MEKSTISVAFVTPLLEGLRRRGFDGDELLDKAGIPPALTALPHARVSAASYATLLRLTAQVLDDEFFGQDRRRMKVGSFAMLGRILIHCDRLDKALDLALRYYALQLDDVYGSLRRDGDLVWLALHPRDAGRPVGVFA